MARPAFENFIAPWETKEGDDITVGELKPDVLKRFLWNLMGDVDKAEDAAKVAKAEAKTLKDEKDAAAHAGDDELTREKRRADKAEADLKAEQEKTATLELDKVRAEVGTAKSLTEAQMGYLSGKDKAELEKAADKFIEDNGLTASKGDGESEDDGTGKVPLVRPAAKTPGDPNPGEPKDSDPTEWARGFRAQQNPL